MVTDWFNQNTLAPWSYVRLLIATFCWVPRVRPRKRDTFCKPLTFWVFMSKDDRVDGHEDFWLQERKFVLSSMTGYCAFLVWHGKESKQQLF